jgi:ketosteroid isomerase-like protein
MRHLHTSDRHLPGHYSVRRANVILSIRLARACLALVALWLLVSSGARAQTYKQIPSQSAADLTITGGAATKGEKAQVSEADDAVMRRDVRAENAIIESMHRLHIAFDNRDIVTISDYIADDDFLFVYELDPSGRPVKLNSKAELLAWLHNMFKEFGQQNARTEAREPVMTARATATFGMVTEECKLKILMPDGTIQLEALRATAVARKGHDGWKFTHWHMSPSAQIAKLAKSGASTTQ